jgi:hypothetical protein
VNTAPLPVAVDRGSSYKAEKRCNARGVMLRMMQSPPEDRIFISLDRGASASAGALSTLPTIKVFSDPVAEAVVKVRLPLCCARFKLR